MRNFSIQMPDFSKPLKKTILGVSLINGRLRALAVVKDQVMANWESPQTIETSEQLKSALKGAIQETGYPGEKISFLIEDKRFVHQYLQVPAMKLADLRLYLASAVEDLKPWEGPATWRFRTTQPARGKMGVLLDIWPKEYVDDLVNVCQELNVVPIQIAPLSATFVEQVRSLPLENEDVVLLVTLMSDKIALLVAKGDGTPLFERFLSPTREGVDASERIGHEITRSILFCSQQFSINVSQIWIVGDSSSVSTSNMQPFVGMTIMESPMNPDPSYWIWVSLSLSVQHPNNFTSREIRLAPLRKHLIKLTAAAILGFLLLGVGLTSFLQGRLNGERGLAHALAIENQDLAQEKDRWEMQLKDLREKEERVKQILGERPSPLPGLVLSYLGNALPSALTLTKAAVRHESSEWKVELTGLAPGDLVIGSQTLAKFEKELREGPYHIALTEDWREAWLQQASSQQRISHEQPRQFSLQGQIVEK